MTHSNKIKNYTFQKSIDKSIMISQVEVFLY